MRRTRRQTVGSKMMHRTKQLSFAQSYQTIICHREPRAELRRSGTTKWRSLDKCIQVAAAHGQTNMLRYVQSIRLGHPSCVKNHAQECVCNVMPGIGVLRTWCQCLDASTFLQRTLVTCPFAPCVRRKRQVLLLRLGQLVRPEDRHKRARRPTTTAPFTNMFERK